MVPAARSVTSSTVKVCLTAETRSIARCGKRFFSWSQRPRMQDLSRWMWVSTKPEQTSRPPACASSFAAPASPGRWRRCARPSRRCRWPADPAGCREGARRVAQDRNPSPALFAMLPGTHVAGCVLAFIAFEGSAVPCSRRRFSVLRLCAARGSRHRRRADALAVEADPLDRQLSRRRERPTSCREPWPSISAAGSASRSSSRTSPARAACWAPTSSPRRGAMRMSS